MKRTTLLTIICGIAIFIGGLVWLNRPRLTFDSDPDAYMIKTMVPVYKALPFVEVETFGSVRAALSDIEIIGATPVEVDSDAYKLPLTERLKIKNEPIHTTRLTQGMIDSLLNQLAELIYFRMINDDPKRYIEIRATRGAHPPSQEQLIAMKWGELEPEFQHYAGRSVKPGEDTADLIVETFDMWIEDTSIGGLRAIAGKGDGAVCAIGLIDTTRDISADLFTTPLGIEGWAGSAPATGGTLLFPNDTIDQLLETYGALPYARAGLVIDYKKGPPQAVVFEFFWNPRLGDWQFASALFINRSGQNSRNLPHF